MSSTNMPTFPLAHPPIYKSCNQPSRLQPLATSTSPASAAARFKPSTMSAMSSRKIRLAIAPSFSPRCTNKKDSSTFYACAVGACRMTKYNGQGWVSRTPPSSPSKSRQNSTTPSPTSYTSSPETPQSARSNMPPATMQEGVDSKYIRLINHVLARAETAQFPNKSLDLDDMFAALPSFASPAQWRNTSPQTFRIQSATEFERFSKIGAVGELYASFDYSPWS